MRATCPARDFLCLLLVYLLCPTCAGAMAARWPPSSRRAALSAGVHHRPLTDEQKADQNLQFMMSLYQSAAEPDGRPKQRRKFGSNTVRLLKPSASSVSYLPASTGEFNPHSHMLTRDIGIDYMYD